ncbi:uncharacterized protein LOC8275748 [Ricinus communis]|uniref:Uncharacterized protein n=1 Tax=Ricinus communis TaxID=3988 RepID=B9T2S0_RICCO|nr:uncharacterized protein LOC8275748 [Ricinus communis]XP_015582951.1 uncharacterized protein LOC8275748 [Ricinus communis]EEF29833.1 conserved hypothetical protein [Ricinus communis]|eukprot:XP_015582950.1 uncharacterized protein LOC8275748 [Ricinus communis]
MNTLNKICTALTIIFAVSLVVLIAEVLYVLYRRRRFHNRTGDLEFSSETSSFYPTTPSKELLYFFCWKNQTSTRIEPDAETAASDAAATAAPPTTTSDDADVDEMLKRHVLYGPSRALFTIREEEREEIETDLSSVEREENNKKKNRKKKLIRSLSSEEVSSIAIATATATDVMIAVDDTTPFSTPCASPPYYTPSPSPPRERN